MTTELTYTEAKAVHPLAPAVLAQLGGDDEDILTATEAANHGANGGFNGFTRYDECRDFVRGNKAAVLDELRKYGDDMVYTVRGFACLGDDYTPDAIGSVVYGDGSDAGDAAPMIFSALAWFALEVVGSAILAATD